MVPWMESLTCGSPRTLSPSALGATELPAVARPAGGAGVWTGGMGRPAAGGAVGAGEVGAAGESAAFGAQEFAIALRQKVALELDIEVVFDGQGESILQREVEVPRADELVHARRVVELHRGRRARDAGWVAGLRERETGGQGQRQGGASSLVKHFESYCFLPGAAFSGAATALTLTPSRTSSLGLTASCWPSCRPEITSRRSP